MPMWILFPPDLLLSDKRLFETKRKDQLNALKNLVELNDINQQYKIIDIMLKGLFKVWCLCGIWHYILTQSVRSCKINPLVLSAERRIRRFQPNRESKASSPVTIVSKFPMIHLNLESDSAVWSAIHLQ